MDVELLGKLSQCSIALDGGKRHFRLEGRCVVPARSSLHGAADVFGPGGSQGAAAPAVDVKSLHAKIGELTLENDFLEGALGKAGC